LKPLEDSNVTGYEQLALQLRKRTLSLAVVGLGYVGLPVAVAFARRGFRVVGFDVDSNVVEALRSGRSHVDDVADEDLIHLVSTGQLVPTNEPDLLGGCHAALIAVPTPLTRTQDPDLSYIIAASETVGKSLARPCLVVLESTTWPGTTEEVVLPILTAHSRQLGKDLFLAFSPERIDPGSPTHRLENTPKLVGGADGASTQLAQLLYSSVVERVVPVSSTRVAEMSKLFENIFRVVNVAMVNEMALLCDRMGLSIWEVLDAAFTKPFGIMPFYPGPGVGGHCIPIDPFYLTWKAREFDFNTRFVQLAGEINIHMPYFVREKVARALNRHRKPINGSSILLLGLAYKKDVADCRESPTFKIYNLLVSEGAKVSVNDPLVPRGQDGRGTVIETVPLTEDLLLSSDCTVIVTDHSSYDYDLIVRLSKVVVDTRNATRHLIHLREKVVLL
jgi:UDP-N-acetyl-D-glucosamine dehydrogenase